MNQPANSNQKNTIKNHNIKNHNKKETIMKKNNVKKNNTRKGMIAKASIVTATDLASKVEAICAAATAGAKPLGLKERRRLLRIRTEISIDAAPDTRHLSLWSSRPVPLAP